MKKETNRRQFLAATAAVGAASLASTSLAASGGRDKAALSGLAHMVFFWLNNPASDTDRQKLIAGIKAMSSIETIRSLHVGVPASTEERDVVDNSYDVSIMMLFDSVEDEHTYQVHPLHQKFVEEHAPLWRKVVVYDSIAA